MRLFLIILSIYMFAGALFLLTVLKITKWAAEHNMEQGYVYVDKIDTRTNEVVNREKMTIPDYILRRSSNGVFIFTILMFVLGWPRLIVMGLIERGKRHG